MIQIFVIFAPIKICYLVGSESYTKKTEILCLITLVPAFYFLKSQVNTPYLQLDKIVSLASGVSPLVTNIEVELETKESTFEVSMAVFTDRSFAEPVSDNYTVNVPDKLFVGLVLAGGEGGMILQGRSCWATPRYHSKYIFSGSELFYKIRLNSGYLCDHLSVIFRNILK